jgi:hypothetical protein
MMIVVRWACRGEHVSHPPSKRTNTRVGAPWGQLQQQQEHVDTTAQAAAWRISARNRPGRCTLAGTTGLRLCSRHGTHHMGRSNHGLRRVQGDHGGVLHGLHKLRCTGGQELDLGKLM